MLVILLAFELPVRTATVIAYSTAVLLTAMVQEFGPAFSVKAAFRAFVVSRRVSNVLSEGIVAVIRPVTTDAQPDKC